MSCEGLFLEQLRQRGFRLTSQRELVLQGLHQIGHPVPAEELFAWVLEHSSGLGPRKWVGLGSQKTPGLELSTVYRTLDLLHALNIVTIIDRGDKQRLFELAGHSAPHLHLVCRICGKITAVELTHLHSLFEHIHQDLQFQTDLSSLTLVGVCQNCQSERADTAEVSAAHE
jgi:Fur family transcriptional regulator, ferric uptake regulator